MFLLKGIIEQAERAGLKMGFPLRVVPISDDIAGVAHIISVVVRAAMIFGNIQPGDYAGMNKYAFERIFAFVNAFGPLGDITVACGGAIAMASVITDDSDDVWPVRRHQEEHRRPHRDMSKPGTSRLRCAD